MKLKARFCGVLVLLNLGMAAFGQGTFQNLDFESANLPAVPAGQYGSLVPISAALPNWTAYLGTNEITQVLHNNYTLGAASISILGPNWTYSTQLDGNYTLLLQPGLVFPPIPSGMQVDASIGQTAFLPVSAKSLRFKSGITPHFFQVSVGVQSIPVVVLAANPAFRWYGADISAFAGQTDTLRITALSHEFDNKYDLLDSIEFSPEAIPEPGVVGLIGLGTLFFGWRLLSRSRS